MEHRVCIDASLCIGCGTCVADCPASNLELRTPSGSKPGGAALPEEPRGAAVVQWTDSFGQDTHVRRVACPVDPENCLFCGHCEAVCPTAAVTLTGFEEEPEEVHGPVRLDPEELLQAIRTRRSIRHFKKTPVPEDILEKVLEAGRLTQTAKNSQRQSYVVLQKQIDAAEKLAVEGLRAVLAEEAAKAGADSVSPLGRTQVTDDFMFFGAPAAIVVLSPSKTDGCLAAQNMSLMAEACGLGVLFSGFFTDIANAVPALSQMLGIDETRQAVATLVLGWPDIKYRRTVRREPLRVTRL